MTEEDILLGRRRARQPTTHERRFGLAARPTRPVPVRRDYAAPPLDKQRNAAANGGNRSYSYLTASDLFSGRTWK